MASQAALILRVITLRFLALSQFFFRDGMGPFKRVLFAYRECPPKNVRGCSPFEIIMGRNVSGPLAILRELWTKEKKKSP